MVTLTFWNVIIIVFKCNCTLIEQQHGLLFNYFLNKYIVLLIYWLLLFVVVDHAYCRPFIIVVG